MKNNQIVSVLLMIILLVCATFLDYGYNRFEEIFASQLQFAPLYWYRFIASLLWAAMVMGVVWYVLVANPRSQIVALTYLLVGALSLTLLIFVLELSYLLGPLVPPTQGIRMRLADISYSPLSLTTHTAALITLIGAVRLLPDRFKFLKNR